MPRKKTELSLEKQIKKYIADKVPVVIHWNIDNGTPMWHVSVRDDEEFWLDSFIHLDWAVEYCKKNKLPIEVRRPGNGRGG